MDDKLVDVDSSLIQTIDGHQHNPRHQQAAAATALIIQINKHILKYIFIIIFYVFYTYSVSCIGEITEKSTFETDTCDGVTGNILELMAEQVTKVHVHALMPGDYG